MRDLRSPVQRRADEALARTIESGLSTLVDYAEKMGRHWTHFVLSEDSHGRDVWVAIVQVTIKYDVSAKKRR